MLCLRYKDRLRYAVKPSCGALYEVAEVPRKGVRGLIAFECPTAGFPCVIVIASRLVWGITFEQRRETRVF